jgi:hypothetical protein
LNHDRVRIAATRAVVRASESSRSGSVHPVTEEKTIKMCALLDRLTEDADAATRVRLAGESLLASRYEWMFFDMA